MKAIEKLTKRTWLKIAIVNLFIVSFLGLILRSKILFDLPFIDYKHTLHAHSHFAFGGWVTLAVLTLFIHNILQQEVARKPVYNWLLGSIMLNSVGMLVSFLLEGYGFYSILFSTLFIIVTYIVSWKLLRDIRKSSNNRSVKLLSIFALAYLVLSSVGPFTLAYLLASKSGNILLYKDAIYTYLHLQYNGFFTLSVFAFFFQNWGHISFKTNRNVQRFAILLSLSVIPSMFMSYLWHYPGIFVQIIAVTGCCLLWGSLFYFTLLISEIKMTFKSFTPVVRNIMILALTAFVLKTIMQSLTIVPSIGAHVFSNRPVIIGFLHLVLLGFISLYLLAALVNENIFSKNRLTAGMLYMFVFGVVLNEIALMSQGLGFMFMKSSESYSWILLAASLLLFTATISLLLLSQNKLTNRYYNANTKRQLINN
jgi:hypothetical protein